MTWFGLGSAAWGVLLIVFVLLWLRRRRRQRQGLEEDGGADPGGGGGLFGLFGRGDYLCDDCRYDYGAACTRPERPNARKCPEYRKR